MLNYICLTVRPLMLVERHVLWERLAAFVCGRTSLLNYSRC